MSFDPTYLHMALDLAVENVRSGRGGPFGAVIVRDGRVVGSGTNLVTTANDPTAHAEINAIREACRTLGTFRLDGCVLYSSCEPCPMCLGAVYWGRLERVYYAATRDDAARAGFDDAAFYREFVCAPHERTIPMEQAAMEDAAAPFLAWAAYGGRIDY